MIIVVREISTGVKRAGGLLPLASSVSITASHPPSRGLGGVWAAGRVWWRQAVRHIATRMSEVGGGRCLEKEHSD
ncbi:hypothetical protein E2C01_062836 [Portunus trituberculatus]|uniref:Uncharacterized protein n=1 Tax=Portunus trituberculatus TaxID=210409 RepID=A0A5B7HEU7_PORTR|nr:hypothetical protein [Portunus trituberculatus]